MSERYAVSGNPQGGLPGSGGTSPGTHDAARDHVLTATTKVMPSPGLLTTALIARGLVDPGQLSQATSLAQEWNTPLGDVLIAKGWVRPIDYYQLVAELSRLPFCNLDQHPPETNALVLRDIRTYLTDHYVPLARIPAQSPATAPPRLITAGVTTPRDIRELVLRHFSQRISARSVALLKSRAPSLSAHLPVTVSQIVLLLAAVTALAMSFWVYPTPTVLGLNVFFSIVFLSLIALRFCTLFVDTTPEKRDLRSRPKDSELPVYTILVPLFRERKILPFLARALAKLDYPAAKLDIKFIFEEEDRATLNAAKALNLPGNIEFLVAPKSHPQTKPKALNFGLPFARGAFTVIYDAEDRPHPNQLREAIAAFQAGPENLACVQARLNFYNIEDNWLTRQFAIEYASLFDLMLPLIERLGLALPLGGTSNHFRTDYLRQVLGWDPYNVTEDADLGIRLARLGYQTSIDSSITFEEATGRMRPWLNQRSRWLKGWMQTYFVHMRNPLRLLRDLGLRGFLGFQVTIGAMIASALLHPVFLITMLAAAGAAYSPADGFSWFAVALAVLNGMVLTGGYLVSICVGMRAALRYGGAPLAAHALLMPLYWLLISLGAYKALWQFLTRPFYWEKTQHGLSPMFDASGHEQPDAAIRTPVQRSA